MPTQNLHGKDWIDNFGDTVYNGADEIRLAARGFQATPSFRDATYFCSPGQRRRAEIYALAYGLPFEVVAVDTSIDRDEQFHGPLNMRHLALSGLTQVYDPYGTILASMTQDRLPADGNVGTAPELLADYAALPWYAS